MSKACERTIGQKIHISRCDDESERCSGSNRPRRGAPYHPQTQGKIERWHQTLKNRILLENYYLPGDLENQISPLCQHH